VEQELVDTATGVSEVTAARETTASSARGVSARKTRIGGSPRSPRGVIRDISPDALPTRGTPRALLGIFLRGYAPLQPGEGLPRYHQVIARPPSTKKVAAEAAFGQRKGGWR